MRRSSGSCGGWIHVAVTFFHGEGDVWAHTRMVCEALVGLPAWQSLPPDERQVLFGNRQAHSETGSPPVT